MPTKTTKAKTRRVTLPASVIMRPSADDIAEHGMPYYTASDHSDGGVTFTPLPDRDVLLALCGPAPAEPNATLRAIIAGDGDETDIVLFDATAPDNDISDAPFTGLLAGSIGAPAEPIIAETAEPALPGTDTAIARMLAAKAVAAFYAGASLPFKSAHDLKRKAPINFALNRAPSARSAALLAAILTYCDVQPGTLQFVRGSGAVPRKLLGLTERPDDTMPAGPESGGLSNCIPDRIEYVSGATAGAGCENAVLRINHAGALANLRAFNEKQADGEHLFSGAIALLELLAQPVAPPTVTNAEPVTDHGLGF